MSTSKIRFFPELGRTDTEIKYHLETLIKEKNLAIENLTCEQFAEVLLQAIKAGDFQRMIYWDTAQAVVYIPYRRVLELEQKLDAYKKIIENFMMDVD